MEEEYSFVLALFDIDKFKSINDAYGHNTGDAILKETASRVKKAIPQGDLVGRLAEIPLASTLISKSN